MKKGASFSLFGVVAISFMSCDQNQSGREASEAIREGKKSIEELKKEEQKRLEALEIIESNKNVAFEVELLASEKLVIQIENQTKEYEGLKNIYLNEINLQNEREKSSLDAACAIRGILYSRKELIVFSNFSPKAKIASGIRLEVTEVISNEDRKGIMVRYYPELSDDRFFIEKSDLNLVNFSYRKDDLIPMVPASENAMLEALRELARLVGEQSRKEQERIAVQEKIAKEEEVRRTEGLAKQSYTTNYSSSGWNMFSDGHAWANASPEEKRRIAEAMSSRSTGGNSPQFYIDAYDSFYSDLGTRDQTMDDMSKLFEGASRTLPKSQRNY